MFPLRTTVRNDLTATDMIIRLQYAKLKNNEMQRTNGKKKKTVDCCCEEVDSREKRLGLFITDNKRGSAIIVAMLYDLKFRLSALSSICVFLFIVRL